METDENARKVAMRIRKIADAYIENHQMGSALFWSGQAMCLSKSNQDDVLRFAECLIIEKQYHRAAHLLKSHSLESTNIRGCYLAVKAAYESKELEDAVVIMDKADNMIKTERQKLPEYSINGIMNTPFVSVTPFQQINLKNFRKKKSLSLAVLIPTMTSYLILIS